jgi:ribosomal-protein-serine acetyltransferase
VTNAFRLPTSPLADERIRLRAPAEADVSAVHHACQDPAIQHFTFVPVPYEREHARSWIAGAPRDRADGVALDLMIESHAGAFLGVAGLLRPDWPNGTVEIGYWVAPWGRGAHAAARATRLLAVHALRDLGFARVVLEIDVENAASNAVAEEAGFVREGTARSAIEAKGRRWTLAMYAMLPEDL